MHFWPDRGQPAALLGMSITFDWEIIQGWNLMGLCRVSGPIVVYGYASVCVCVPVQFGEGYEWKGTLESIVFLYFIAVYTNQGWHDTGGC